MAYATGYLEELLSHPVECIFLVFVQMPKHEICIFQPFVYAHTNKGSAEHVWVPHQYKEHICIHTLNVCLGTTFTLLMAIYMLVETQ